MAGAVPDKRDRHRHGHGVNRTVVSNQTGQFTFAGLSPGGYSVKVEMSGFNAVTVTLPAPVSGGEVRDLGKLTLKLGGVQKPSSSPRLSPPCKPPIARA